MQPEGCARIPAVPRDPLSVIQSMQDALAELRQALAAPGPLGSGVRVLAVAHVNAVAVTLGKLRCTLRRETEDSHA